jgi:hypothetical protein
LGLGTSNAPTFNNVKIGAPASYDSTTGTIQYLGTGNFEIQYATASTGSAPNFMSYIRMTKDSGIIQVTDYNPSTKVWSNYRYAGIFAGASMTGNNSGMNEGVTALTIYKDGVRIRYLNTGIDITNNTIKLVINGNSKTLSVDSNGFVKAI